MESLGLVPMDLDDQERAVLVRGMVEWGGPARCTEELARAMGFLSLADFDAQRSRLVAALESGEPLSPRDWRRTLLATEIVFASDVVGSGVDWYTTTGPQDIMWTRSWCPTVRR